MLTGSVRDSDSALHIAGYASDKRGYITWRHRWNSVLHHTRLLTHSGYPGRETFLQHNTPTLLQTLSQRRMWHAERVAFT